MSKRSIFYALCLFSMEACISDSLHEYEPKIITITDIKASFHEETKTFINGDTGSIFWNDNDSISVLYGSQNSKFISTLPGGYRYTAFSGRIDLNPSSEEKVFAVYPYHDDNARSGDSVIVTLNSIQSTEGGSFDPTAMVSVSQCDPGESSFQFHHLCGGLRFKIKTESISKVEFRGNNNEVIAGTVEVSFENGMPVVSKVINPETVASLICPEGFETGKWYYMTMLPAELSEGFNITLYDDNTSQVYQSTKKTIIKRSVFGQISKLDDGLEFDNDWIHNAFVHRSLMLAVPNCYDDGIIYPSYGAIRDMENFCNYARTDADGMMEFARVFYNGPAPTADIDKLQKLFNFDTLPFCVIDYRRKSVDYAMISFGDFRKETASLYGTASGIGIQSFFEGDRLTMNISLHFKVPGDYKVVTMVTENDASYQCDSYDGEIFTETNQSDVTRFIATDILGDDVTVEQRNVIKYRSYIFDVPQDYDKTKLKVLVYVLREYGDRQVVRDGDYGNWYVDNAYSVKAGQTSNVPQLITIDSTIEPLTDYGTL